MALFASGSIVSYDHSGFNVLVGYPTWDLSYEWLHLKGCFWQPVECHPKLHRVLGQLTALSRSMLVPFPALLSMQLRIWGFAFFLPHQCYRHHKSVCQKVSRATEKKSYLWDSAEVCQHENKAVLEGDLPRGNIPEKHQLPRVKTLEIHGEKGHARAVIALVFKQKRRAGQPAVRQPSGYSSQSPAGSKCIVGYPSKVV